MGLYFLNISVDTADLHPEHVSENLSVNDQESLIEIFVEKVLGYEDAIKEYDDTDPEDHNTNTTVKIKFAQYTIDADDNPSFVKLIKQKFPDYSTYLIKGYHQLDTPPPRIWFFLRPD